MLAPAGMRDTYFPGTDPRIRGPHNLGYQRVERADGTTEFLDVTESRTRRTGSRPGFYDLHWTADLNGAS